MIRISRSYFTMYGIMLIQMPDPSMISLLVGEEFVGLVEGDGESSFETAVKVSSTAMVGCWYS
jgi:hypothetical protein